MKRFAVAATLTVALAMTTAGVVLAPASGANGDSWQGVKAATARFHSFTQAEHAGYSTENEPCVESPDGAMGIHAVNHEAVGDQTIDPYRPEVLLYNPHNGGLKLVAIEYLQVAVVDTPNGPAPHFGSEPPADGFLTPTPSVFGQSFDGPMPGHHPLMPWHYDLHVWLWETNPAGLFAPFNAALSCPA